MKQYLISILMILSALSIFATDNLDINNTYLNTAYPNKFTGISSMAIDGQLKFSLDSSSNTYSTNMYDTVFSLLKPLHLKVLRFPGGTIGNYYHFYGKGYGVDTSETNCAPDRVGSVFANQFLSIDHKADKNIIEYFKQELDTLKNNGDEVGVVYRLNSHTHFYKGDLIKYTDSIQYLIDLYMNHDVAFLNSNGSSLDTNKVISYATKLVQIQNDSVIGRIKESLMNDAGFYHRFKENLDAIKYLKSNNISVLGIEIGNETYAEYVVFDDDLSYVGYDCTNIPDSFSLQIYQLPMKYYFEGLIKNWILISLYSDSIKMKYNIPIGVPAPTGFTYLSLNNNYYPIFIKQYGAIAKKADLWNRYYGIQPSIQALIPHIYSQNFLDCSSYVHNLDSLGLSKYQIDKITERFLKASIDSVVTFNLQRILYFGNNKPLWITEWNFSDNSYATNTFLHAVYDYYFIRKEMEIHEYDSRIAQVWLYHLLIGSYYPWPIIRTSYNTQNQYQASKQITYEPFYIWSNTFAQQVKRLKTPFWQNTVNNVTDAFINPDKNELYIQYVNTDSAAHYLSLKKIKITNGIQELIPEKISRYLLDAVSLTSTNYTPCAYLCNQPTANSYEIINDTLTNLDSLLLPGISMGKFTVQLKNKMLTNLHLQGNNFGKIFPNPTKNSINITLNEFSLQDNYSYSIYNLLGTLLLEGTIKQHTYTINIADLAAGLYFIQLKQNNETIDNQKIVIN